MHKCTSLKTPLVYGCTQARGDARGRGEGRRRHLLVLAPLPDLAQLARRGVDVAVRVLLPVGDELQQPCTAARRGAARRVREVRAEVRAAEELRAAAEELHVSGGSGGSGFPATDRAFSGSAFIPFESIFGRAN